MRRKLADHDCWAKMPLPDIGNTRTLLGNAEPIGTPGTPLLWKTAVPVPSVSLGNLPYPETLPLVGTGVKEIPPFAQNPAEPTEKHKGPTSAQTRQWLIEFGLDPDQEDDPYEKMRR